MTYYLLEPEVAGEIGENSIISYENGMIKEVKYLEYCFMGWLGDELLTSTPCFIVSRAVQEEILAENLTGIQFEEITMSFSDEFEELYEGEAVPEFVRIICENSYESNIGNLTLDFYMNEYKDLIVSEKALAVFKRHKLNNCDIVLFN